jgi:hypothetical protein
VLASPQCSAHAEGEDAERNLLALVSGHRETDGKSHEHHKHRACPVCSTLSALAGVVLAAPPVLSFRALAAYRSRAPPSA